MLIKFDKLQLSIYTLQHYDRLATSTVCSTLYMCLIYNNNQVPILFAVITTVHLHCIQTPVDILSWFPTRTLTTRTWPSFPGWTLVTLPSGEWPRVLSAKITNTISPILRSLWDFHYFFLRLSPEIHSCNHLYKILSDQFLNSSPSLSRVEVCFINWCWGKFSSQLTS